MKHLNKILIAMFLFSLSVAFCVYAEETKTTENVQTDIAKASVASAVKAGYGEQAQTAIAEASVASAVKDELASEAQTATQAVVPVVEKTTLDNLQAAFDGESNANARYLAFAKKADAEGYGKAASLFRAAARAEQVHFERHAKVIKELGGTPTAKIETPAVKSTEENLKAAMEGEIYESTVMYPEFLAKAQKDKSKEAIDAFEDAGKAEAVHASFYKTALGNLKGWKGSSKDFYVCPFCGNVVAKTNFRACPICGESKLKFIAVS